MMKFLPALLLCLIGAFVAKSASADEYVVGRYGIVPTESHSTWTTPDRTFGGWSTPTRRGSYAKYPGGHFQSYDVRPRHGHHSHSVYGSYYGARSYRWDSPRWYWNR